MRDLEIRGAGQFAQAQTKRVSINAVGYGFVAANLLREAVEAIQTKPLPENLAIACRAWMRRWKLMEMYARRMTASARAEWRR